MDDMLLELYTKERPVNIPSWYQTKPVFVTTRSVKCWLSKYMTPRRRYGICEPSQVICSTGSKDKQSTLLLKSNASSGGTWTNVDLRNRWLSHVGHLLWKGSVKLSRQPCKPKPGQPNRMIWALQVVYLFLSTGWLFGQMMSAATTGSLVWRNCSRMQWTLAYLPNVNCGEIHKCSALVILYRFSSPS